MQSASQRVSKHRSERLPARRLSPRETSGDVRVFSSLHVSGEQLTQLTGVAAILRFPCPEIEPGALAKGEEMPGLPPALASH